MENKAFKVPRNAPCPCGSGKKYKKCSCYEKGFEWTVDENNDICQTYEMSDEFMKLAEYAKATFEEKHQREIRPEDPIFAHLFDGISEADLQEIEGEFLRAMGFDDAMIYATEKTGLMVGHDNRHNFSDAQIKEFEGIAEEYRQAHAC